MYAVSFLVRSRSGAQLAGTKGLYGITSICSNPVLCRACGIVQGLC